MPLSSVVRRTSYPCAVNTACGNLPSTEHILQLSDTCVDQAKRTALGALLVRGGIDPSKVSDVWQYMSCSGSLAMLPQRCQPQFCYLKSNLTTIFMYGCPMVALHFLAPHCCIAKAKIISLIPISVFLTIGCSGSEGGPLWWQRLTLALHRRPFD